jgi:hypothetical protein
VLSQRYSFTTYLVKRLKCYKAKPYRLKISGGFAFADTWKENILFISCMKNIYVESSDKG